MMFEDEFIIQECESFEQQLFNVNNNYRLLTKEATIYFFMKNQKRIRQNRNYDEDFFEIDNLNEIADELFSRKNVHVFRYPCDSHFDRNGIYVRKRPTFTKISFDKVNIVKSVDEYLNTGAVVYIYQIYGLTQGVFCEKETKRIPTYWWRMACVKEE